MQELPEIDLRPGGAEKPTAFGLRAARAEEAYRNFGRPPEALLPLGRRRGLEGGDGLGAHTITLLGVAS